MRLNIFHTFRFIKSGSPEAERPLLYLAGLYSVWRPPGLPDQPPVLSYSLLTREAGPVLAWLHHRQPSFLRPDQVTHHSQVLSVIVHQ